MARSNNFNRWKTFRLVEGEDINDFFYKALFVIGMKHWRMDELLPIVMQTGEIII